MHINLQMMRDALGKFKEVRFQEVTINEENLVIVHYMIWNNNLLSEPLSLEARGSVFNARTGECICRPFEKFFNIGEQEFTQPSKLINLPWENATVTKKRDGSLLTPVLVRGKIFWKSKKSFESDLVKSFEKVMLPHIPESQIAYIGQLLMSGLTPIFEYTSPDWKIVINYGAKPKLTLLAIRNNATGEYLDITNSPMDRIEVVPQVSLDDLFEMQHTVEGEEGWVVHFGNDGIRVKFKTEWYLARHRVLDLRERDVADAVIAQTIDDIYPMIQECGYDLQKIHDIEHHVVMDLVEIEDEVNRFERKTKDVPRDSLDKEMEGHEDILPMLFALRDHNLDRFDRMIIKRWQKLCRKNYSLSSVTNPNFGQSD